MINVLSFSSIFWALEFLFDFQQIALYFLRYLLGGQIEHLFFDWLLL